MLRVLVVALLALAACGTPAAAGPDVRGAWELESEGRTATLVVEDGLLRGTSFCNSFSGTYRLDGDSLAVEDLGWTERGCAPEVMAAEAEFLAALGSADRMVLDGDELAVSGAGSTLRFRPQQPVEDRALAGTRWVLDTLVDGELASSVPVEAVLELARDGSATGSTGCKGLVGTWSASEGVLTVVATRDDVGCTGDRGRQDAHVLAVLDAAPRFEIAGDRLTLTAPDGRGLAYRG